MTNSGFGTLAIGTDTARTENSMHELLSVAQMAEADRLTVTGGMRGIDLMENAGRAVFETVTMLAPRGAPILVACGPGNNGGDGFIAARRLKANGFAVKIALAGDPERLAGDAALAFRRWGGTVAELENFDPANYPLIVDALLGAGLDRPVSGAIAGFIASANAAGTPIVSVDLPSGIHGDTGQIMGSAFNAAATVTFFRKKSGHLLMPGRDHCGEINVADIGIGASTLDGLGPFSLENNPEIWRSLLPLAKTGGHKYDRGHAIIVSGAMSRTGAARLAARSALRVGAGLVTLASPPEALTVNAGHLTEIMLARMDGSDGLAAILSDKRVGSVAAGPALGPGKESRGLVAAILAAGSAAVLDADALTCFEDEPGALFSRIASSPGPVVITPHEGEFLRLFGRSVPAASKTGMAIEAARLSGAVLVYKGADTVVASPAGLSAVNANAPPWLATAGSGDVLCGMICGLLAQRMPAFEAACAAVWMHGAAAAASGHGMVAGDIETGLPDILAKLHQT